MALPVSVSNNQYTIVYVEADALAYRTAKQKVDKKVDKKEHITVFTALTEAEYTAIIASDWS